MSVPKNEYGEKSWGRLLCSFGRDLVHSLGYHPDMLPKTHNIIVDALQRPGWVADAGARFGNEFNRTSLSKVATICQMVVFDANGGPEGDNKQKALRRHWYQWYKVDFAQPLSEALGEDLNDTRWGLNWSGRLSQVYATFVDEMGVTYKDLWVEDASRMMTRLNERLFNNAYIVVAVEKDSLFEDFRAASASIGAACLISGKGKNSKAATEKMLRDVFGWSDNPHFDYETGEPYETFNEKRPLYIIHVSDYDFDGEAVIGPTFGEQARRYTPYVKEARIGVQPAHLVEKGYSLNDKTYQVKLSNSGYMAWAKDKGIFSRKCLNCGEVHWTPGAAEFECPQCWNPVPSPKISKKGDPVYGLEVEAMRVSDYHDLLVHALLTIMPFEEIVGHLRVETLADSYESMATIRHDILDRNEEYQGLLEEFARLESLKLDFETEIEDHIHELAQEHRGDFADEGDDPEVTDFVAHATSRNSWGAWRPFSIYERTQRLTNFLQEEYSETIEDFAEKKIGFIPSLTRDMVRDALSDILTQAEGEAAEFSRGVAHVVAALQDALEL